MNASRRFLLPLPERCHHRHRLAFGSQRAFHYHRWLRQRFQDTKPSGRVRYIVIPGEIDAATEISADRATDTALNEWRASRRCAHQRVPARSQPTLRPILPALRAAQAASVSPVPAA